MLSPIYYEKCADGILMLYEQLENDVISDIIRRIVKTGKVTATAEYQLEILKNSGILYDEILSEIAKKTGETEEKIKIIFEKSGVETVDFDNKIYRENGLNPIEIQHSETLKKTLESGWKKTLKNVKNLTLTTADTSQTAYVNACNSAYMQVASGAFSYQEAIKNAVKKTAENGAFVRYPSGHVERIDVAVRRAVLTGVGQTAREMSVINAEESGCDLMEISAHSGARPSHAKWQGKIVSLSGKKGYLSKRDIGYGTGDGFGGWNCRHDWFPFFEGHSKKNYTEKDLEKLDEKNIEYNGKKYSEYEISQIQRGIEREIRSAKREKIAFETAVDEADDPETRQAMRESLDEAKRKVAEKQRKMHEFVSQTGQNRDYFREQNYPKENSRKDLTSPTDNDKILDKNSGIHVNTKYYNCELKHYVITDERINSVKPIKLDSLSEENNKKLTSACKELLSYVRNEKLGTEALMAFDMDMNEFLRRIASENNGKVSIKNIGEDKCIIIHNHPDGLLFSEKDLQVLCIRSNINILGAVGNDGSIYFVEKTEDFDEYYFEEYMNEIRWKYLIDMPPEEHIKFIEEVLEGSEEYGVKFYTSKN